jgi:hypothetical protein
MTADSCPTSPRVGKAKINDRQPRHLTLRHSATSETDRGDLDELDSSPDRRRRHVHFLIDDIEVTHERRKKKRILISHCLAPRIPIFEAIIFWSFRYGHLTLTVDIMRCQDLARNIEKLCLERRFVLFRKVQTIEAHAKLR